MSRLLAFLASPTGTAVRYVVSLAIVLGFAWSIDWQSLRRIPASLPRAELVAAVVLAGLAYPLMAWRWWTLARVLGYRPPFGWAHRVTWIGQFYASVLPGGLGGEAARAYYVSRTPAFGPRAEGLASILWDRALGLVVLLALTVAGSLLKLQLVVATPALQWLLAAAAAGALLGIGLLWRTRPTNWPGWVQQRIGIDRCQRAEGLLSPVRANGAVMIAALALTLSIWLLDFVAIAFLARGVGLTLPFLDVAIAGCVAYAASVLPISIGGHGVREGALVFTLGALGLVSVGGPERDAVLLLGLLLWAVTVFWSLVGGLMLLRWRNVPPATNNG